MLPTAISLRPLPVDGVVLIRRTVSDVAIAVVATLIAFALLEVATPAGASSATYATSSAAIAIAALWAGVRAGLIATALTAAVTAHLYLEPAGALAVADPGDLIGLALFAMSGLILASLCGWQRSRPSRERGRSDTAPVLVAASTPTRPPRRITRLRGADRGPVITVLNGHPIERLTARELDVLQLLGSGLSNAEIADGLFVSMNTVKSHLKSIFGKLGVVSRTQAVVRAGELGLLAPDRRPTNHAA